jgi:hypothetical protein
MIQGPISVDNLLQSLGISDSFASILSGSSLITALFGNKKPKEKEAGLNLGFDEAGQIFGEQFSDWVAKGGLFSSTKRGTETAVIPTANLQTLQALADTFMEPFIMGIELLGGDVDEFFASFSSGLTRIETKGLEDEEVSALLEEFLRESTADAIATFLRTSDSINETFRTVLSRFQGNMEELVVAFQLVANISAAQSFDVLAEATKAWEESQQTSTEILAHNIGVLREAIAAYDESLASLAALENAYTVVTTSQFDLVAGLMAVERQISDMFQTSAQSIREALLNEEELFNLRREQVDALVAEAAQTTDPAELGRLAEEINRLGLDAFNLLDEGQQADLGEEFINFFTELDTLFGDQIATGIDNVISDQSALDQEVADVMTAAAQATIDAQVAAEDLWRRWREDIEDGKFRFFTELAG